MIEGSKQKGLNCATNCSESRKSGVSITLLFWYHSVTYWILGLWFHTPVYLILSKAREIPISLSLLRFLSVSINLLTWISELLISLNFSWTRLLNFCSDTLPANSRRFSNVSRTAISEVLFLSFSTLFFKKDMPNPLFLIKSNKYDIITFMVI